VTINDEEFNDALSGLSEHDVDPWRRERTRKQAHRMLDRPAQHSTYTRVVEPVLVASFCAVQMLWAFGKAIDILLG